MTKEKTIILFMILLLTGCRNTLNCSIKTNNYNAKIKIKYSNNKPVKYIFKDSMEFPINSENIQWYYNKKNEEYEKIIKTNNVNIKKSLDYVSTRIKYNFYNNNNNKNENLLINNDDTKIKAKQKIESLGYKCN